jgi:hypothetical protein
LPNEPVRGQVIENDATDLVPYSNVVAQDVSDWRIPNVANPTPVGEGFPNRFIPLAFGHGVEKMWGQSDIEVGMGSPSCGGIHCHS